MLSFGARAATEPGFGSFGDKRLIAIQRKAAARTRALKAGPNGPRR